MRALLTSEGLTTSTITQQFIDMLACPASVAKVAFVPTAAIPEGIDQNEITGKKTSILQTGVNQILEVDISKTKGNRLKNQLKDCHALWINGGNTFFLLEQVRKSGLQKYLNTLLENNCLYVGVSAGSIVAGQTITTATWEGYDDQSVVNLKDLTGLKLVRAEIFTHYSPQWTNVVSQNQDTLDHPLITLTDQQALVVENQDYHVI